ncbi:MAG TPA: hypothetical protein VF925_00730 [Casimicrobiaceae bacterium]
MSLPRGRQCCAGATVAGLQGYRGRMARERGILTESDLARYLDQ